MSGRGMACGSVVLLLISGCAGWKQNTQKPTVTEQREDRAADAVRNFENRRDAAQLEAALDRWRQGNAPMAESMLLAIVRRRPDNYDARMRLAELLWSRSDAAAEPHLRAILEAEPNRAEAHHALGLLLEGTGRADEARQHLAKAAELEPENEIYRTTCESLAMR
jgi:Tfp pilus assembly protein PilF